MQEQLQCDVQPYRRMSKTPGPINIHVHTIYCPKGLWSLSVGGGWGGGPMCGHLSVGGGVRNTQAEIQEFS